MKTRVRPDDVGRLHKHTMTLSKDLNLLDVGMKSTPLYMAVHEQNRRTIHSPKLCKIYSMGDYAVADDNSRAVARGGMTALLVARRRDNRDMSPDRRGSRGRGREVGGADGANRRWVDGKGIDKLVQGSREGGA